MTVPAQRGEMDIRSKDSSSSPLMMKLNSISTSILPETSTYRSFQLGRLLPRQGPRQTGRPCERTRRSGPQQGNRRPERGVPVEVLVRVNPEGVEIGLDRLDLSVLNLAGQ